MKSLIPLLHFTLCWVAVPAFGQTQTDETVSQVRTGEWTEEIDQALDLAKERRLPVLLNFTGSDWCSGCRILRRQVFATEAWRDFSRERLMLVTVDFPEAPVRYDPALARRNRGLKDRFHVHAFPTLILLDEDGKTELGRLSGGDDPEPVAFQGQVESLIRYRRAAVEARARELGPEHGPRLQSAVARLREREAELRQFLHSGVDPTRENLKRLQQLADSVERTRERVAEVDSRE